jgi:hypothetical protein
MKEKIMQKINAVVLVKKEQKQVRGGLGTNCNLYDYYCSRTNRCYATASQCSSACRPYLCMV